MVLLMPWLDIRPMDQKIRFIKQALMVRRGEFAGLCRAYGIVRKTSYKSLGCYRSPRTLTPLKEQSRRPRQSPQRILEPRVPDGWDARKIAHLLWEAGCWVSVVTVHRTLLRHGAVHRLDQHAEALRRFERSAPNELLQADFKGPMGRAGQRDEPLTVLDDHSRFALGVFALRDHTWPSVRGCFWAVFERF